MNFQVFGILNTIGEFFAFVMMCFVSLIGAAATVAANEAGADVDGGGLALPITFTILLLAHAICTIIMVRINIRLVLQGDTSCCSVGSIDIKISSVLVQSGASGQSQGLEDNVWGSSPG